MLDAVKRELAAHVIGPEDVIEVWVPGAFEIPLAARRLAIRDDVDCVICIGLVLKGETSHDEHIARAVASGCMQVGLETDKPILFGVLTCATIEQARARALSPEQGGRLDKGREVARAAIEALHALDQTRALGRVLSSAGFGAAAKEARP
jgi:6,7-dimethyl-8-ribityllumazine synthase